jgi:bifunctional non-homologous end joining protein LigD
LVGFIEPCLPSPTKVPPSGTEWIHEIKHDGFRLMARRDGAGVRLITRKGNDFSARFPFIAMAVAALPGHSCLMTARPLSPMTAALRCSSAAGGTIRREAGEITTLSRTKAAPACRLRPVGLAHRSAKRIHNCLSLGS